jgi:hypothetical protein
MDNFGNVVVALFFGLLFLFLLAWTINACIHDARRRGKSPLLVTILVVFFFPVGLIVWLIFRPALIDGGGDRRFRLEDHRAQ